MSSNRTHYEILEVSKDATDEEIKAAYKRLSKKVTIDTVITQINWNYSNAHCYLNVIVQWFCFSSLQIFIPCIGVLLKAFAINLLSHMYYITADMYAI